MLKSKLEKLGVGLKSILNNTITRDTMSTGLDNDQAKTARKQIKKMLHSLSK